MICEQCGKNVATTHIRTVVGGVMTEQHLCHDCAEKTGYTKLHGGSLADMLVSMFADIAPAKTEENTRRCPVCGSSFSDIANTGKAGCAECYKTFYNELLPYLKRVHGSIKHTGQVPNSAPLATVEQEETVDSLRMELNRLVAEEQYEQAAVVRDKIKKLEESKHE